jgi:hypothetical protein
MSSVVYLLFANSSFVLFYYGLKTGHIDFLAFALIIIVLQIFYIFRTWI